MYLSSISSSLLLYDINSWDLIKAYGSHDNTIRDISWSDDGKYLLQVNPKGLVEILNISDHEVKTLQQLPFIDTWSAVFHRDGHRNVAIGTKSGNVMIWDTKMKSIKKTLPTPTRQSCVNCLSYNMNNTRLAASMKNGETIIYSMTSSVPVLTIKLKSSDSISAMKFHHEARSHLGLATDDGDVLIRDINTNKDRVFFENVHASPVTDFTFSQINKDVMLSCGYDNMMHIYDTRLQSIVSTVRTSYVLSSISMNLENQVALGSKNGFILLYDLRQMASPFKILKGHNGEVQRVVFQPTRNKNVLEEVSLREVSQLNTVAQQPSPNKSQHSDFFLINDSIAENKLEVSSPGDAKVDSFLVMMGLDRSNNDVQIEDHKSFLEGNKNTLNCRYPESEKIFNKISTPLNNRPADNYENFSPICPINTETGHNTLKPNNLLTKHSITGIPSCSENINNEIIEELKDTIRISISDVANDNKTYYLSSMMFLTKQKLYLEKKLANMSQQIENLVLNQNNLIEMNLSLVLEVNKLKMAKESP